MERNQKNDPERIDGVVEGFMFGTMCGAGWFWSQIEGLEWYLTVYIEPILDECEMFIGWI